MNEKLEATEQIRTFAEFLLNYNPKDFGSKKEEILFEDDSIKIVQIWKIEGIRHEYKE